MSWTFLKTAWFASQAICLRMDVDEVQPAGLSRKSSGLHSQKLLPHFHQQCKFVTRWMSFLSSKLFIFWDSVIITNFILKTHEIHFSNLSETLKKQNEIRYRGQTQGTQSYRELLSWPCRRAEREVGWRRCLHSWAQGLGSELTLSELSVSPTHLPAQNIRFSSQEAVLSSWIPEPG